MIVTKLNLKKIPSDCSKCKFSKYNYYFDTRFCLILAKSCNKVKLSSGRLGYAGRLKNCPLIKIER